MGSLRIAHLTDLHVRRDYENTMFETELHQRILPVPYVVAGLKEAVGAGPDVMVLTGDLVHEGTADDYRYLKEIIKRYAGDIPVIPVLGNHDCKAAFYEGFLEEERQGPYYGKQTIGGYRFLTLDTSVEGNCDGVLRGEQVRWLLEELKAPAPNGTVLLGHHPLESRQAWFDTEVEEGLTAALQHTDVIAYLCGHAHYCESRTLGRILQVTGESFDYGVETVGDEVIYTDIRAYNSCWLEDRKVIVHTHVVAPADPVICHIPLNREKHDGRKLKHEEKI